MLIGREKEQSLLKKAYTSNEAEFVVIYGRRRIGKTYLLRDFFGKQKCLFMQATGMQKGALKQQLANFADSLSSAFVPGVKIATPKSWMNGFEQLTKFIENYKKTGKIVIFLDELPWMATKKSGLLQAIDYYWNHFWSKNPHIILIACGSSASWLIKNIIYNKGGLHNRATCEINLKPFNLSEVRDYLKSRKIKLNNQHILSLYMALGGVPYYLKYIQPGLTVAQNIQQILFNADASLKGEFKKLFHSLFKSADAYIELIKLISKKKDGIRRSELENTSKLSMGGGRLTSRLKDLSDAGFIEEHIGWQKSRGEYYKLIDEFSLFYLHWLDIKNRQRFTQDYWIHQSDKPAYKIWAGYAFESVCIKHIEQIIKALKIEAGAIVSSWRFIPRKHIEKGAQIDLLIDRNDGAINLCEIKCTNKPFKIDKEYAAKLMNKTKVFKEKTKTKKQIFIAMISANGIQPTMYSEEIISGVVTLENLFS